MASKWGREPDDAAMGETYRLLNRHAQSISLYALHAVCIAVVVFTFIDPGVPALGRALGVAMALWSIGRLLTRRVRVGWIAADLVVVATYLIQTPWLVSGTDFTTGASPMLAVAGTAVIAYGLAYPRRWSGLALLIVMAAWGVGIARVPGAVQPWQVFGFDFLVVEWALVSVCRRLVVRAAVVTDEILISSADDEIARTVAVARHRLARRQCAVMHDTAASTLLMVGQGAAHNTEVLARQVDRDLATIAAFASPAPLHVDQRDVVPSLRALCADTVTATSLAGSDELWLDGDIADAIEGATREALTNVDRHAHARAVTVTATDHGVTIADNGIGFDVASPDVTRRFGVRNSIQSRLSDVGGYARIDSKPGAGTTVILRWDAESSGDGVDLGERVALTTRLTKGFGYGLAVISAVVLLLQSQQALFGEDTHHAAEVVVVVVALVSAIMAGYAVAHPMSGRAIAVMCAVVVALVPVQESLLPPTSLTTGSNWAYGALGWIVVALTYRYPIQYGMAALVAFWALGSLAMLILRPDADVVVTIGYDVVSVALIQALALVFTGFLVSAAGTAQSLNEQHVRRWAAEAEERALADDVAARYSSLSKTLVPMLQKLREPTIDPTDPHLRLEALIEDARLRRLFAQTDNLDHPLLQELQSMIAKAEERGVSVTVDAGTALPDVAPAMRDQLLVVASMALAGTVSRARIVFTATDETVTISVVCDCTPETRDDIEAALGIVPAVAGDLTWVEQDLALPADIAATEHR
ncbi:sensor histidine kinase [Gordonia sp. NPDC003424]